MNCRKAQEYIQLQLDGELPERQRPRLVRHLSDCASCRRAQEQTALMSSAFDELAAATGTAGCSSLAFTAPRHRGWGTPMAVAAAITLMLGVGTLSWQAASDGWFTADGTGPHVTHLSAGEPPGADVTRTIALTRWSAIDSWTWIGLALILLGIAILVVRLGHKVPGVYLQKVYQRH